MPLLQALYSLPAQLALGHLSLTVSMACRSRDQQFAPHKRPSQQVNTWKSFTLHKVGLCTLCVLFSPHQSHRWRRPPWTEFRARCTRGAGQLCRWSVWTCAGGEARTCTGWWSSSWARGLCWQAGGAGPGMHPHCCEEETLYVWSHRGNTLRKTAFWLSELGTTGISCSAEQPQTVQNK